MAAASSKAVDPAILAVVASGLTAYFCQPPYLVCFALYAGVSDTTRSPFWNLITDAPTSSTVPATPLPRMKGYGTSMYARPRTLASKG